MVEKTLDKFTLLVNQTEPAPAKLRGESLKAQSEDLAGSDAPQRPEELETDWLIIIDGRLWKPLPGLGLGTEKLKPIGLRRWYQKLGPMQVSEGGRRLAQWLLGLNQYSR